MWKNGSHLVETKDRSSCGEGLAPGKGFACRRLTGVRALAGQAGLGEGRMPDSTSREFTEGERPPRYRVQQLDKCVR